MCIMTLTPILTPILTPTATITHSQLAYEYLCQHPCQQGLHHPRDTYFCGHPTVPAQHQIQKETLSGKGVYSKPVTSA